MKAALKKYKIKSVIPGSGLQLAWRVFRVNMHLFATVAALVCVSVLLFYVPPLFLRLFVSYLETDPERKDSSWGWFYCAGLFGSNATAYLLSNQMWSISTTSLEVAIRVQLNSILFAKTLVRKDVASSAPVKDDDDDDDDEADKSEKDEEVGEVGFSSKAQIMTLMTTDVDRVSEFSDHFLSLIGMSHYYLAQFIKKILMQAHFTH